MNRVDFKKYVFETYSVEPDCPWQMYQENEVFRHSNNHKWFALMMDVPKEKLGLKDTGLVSVVNLKCPSILLDSLLSKPGFYPAYHMNKANWITAALDGTASDDEIKLLLDMSFEATETAMPNHQHR